MSLRCRTKRARRARGGGEELGCQCANISPGRNAMRRWYCARLMGLPVPGVRCRVDESTDKLIFSIVRHADADGHITFNVESFAACPLIHPNVGVRMVRSRADREPVPADVMHLRRMFQWGLDRDVPAASGCVSCSIHAGCYTCSMCGLAWHDACSGHIASIADGNPTMRDMKAGLRDSGGADELRVPAT
eukprot:1656596-Pyramimonas_sp.AAC.1